MRGRNRLNMQARQGTRWCDLCKRFPCTKKLRHPHLIALEDSLETAHGYAAVFGWFEGECLHPHWQFSDGIGKHHPAGPYARYRKLPVEERLLSLSQIFAFHTFVEANSYVAVDFYDGSLLYDFQNHVTKICDIDFYQKKPVINDLGPSFWGSPRYKSPEEYELGAPIDERTNVYTMGALAFGLLGGELDRSRERWEAGDELYAVARKATEPERGERHGCVREFWEEWRGGLVRPRRARDLCPRSLPCQLNRGLSASLLPVPASRRHSRGSFGSPGPSAVASAVYRS